MQRELMLRLHRSFEDAAYQQDGVECWLARDLQVLLEYTQWRNFQQVIEKAMISCRTAGQDPEHHFADVSKMVALGKGAAPSSCRRQQDDGGTTATLPCRHRSGAASTALAAP